MLCFSLQLKFGRAPATGTVHLVEKLLRLASMLNAPMHDGVAETIDRQRQEVRAGLERGFAVDPFPVLLREAEAPEDGCVGCADHSSTR